MRKSKLEKKLSSIRRFLQQAVEEGELDCGFLQDVEAYWIELCRAANDDDHHTVMVAINEIAKKLRR